MVEQVIQGMFEAAGEELPVQIHRQKARAGVDVFVSGHGGLPNFVLGFDLEIVFGSREDVGTFSTASLGSTGISMRSTCVNWYLAFLLISLAFPALADDRPYKEYKNPIFDYELFKLRLKEVLPPDAAEYVDLLRNCQHWREEDAYDKERSEEIRRGAEKNCTGLEDRGKSLDTKYQSETRESKVTNSIIREIEAGEEFPSFIFDDPQRKSAILNEYYEARAQWIVRSVNQQIPKYEAVMGRLRNETGKATDTLMNELKITKFMLEGQQRYLVDVMKNIDRLHPITQGQIKRLEPKLLKALAVPG